MSMRSSVIHGAAVLVTLGLLTGCSSSGGSADGGQSTASADAATPSLSDSPTTEASPLEPDLVYLALGDSNVYGDPADCDSCTTYPSLLAELITQNTGTTVGLIDASQHNSLTSHKLLTEIRNDAWGGTARTDMTPRSAVAAADLITITVGANMMLWYQDSDPCGTSYDAACIAQVEQPTMADIDGILKEIAAIRGDRPTAVRVTTFHNDLIAGPGYNPAVFGGPGSDAFSAEAIGQSLTTARSFLDTWEADMCTVAQHNGAACVDIYRALAGLNGDQPLPAGWYQSDFGDMNQAGQDFYAAQIFAVGFEPLVIGK